MSGWQKKAEKALTASVNDGVAEKIRTITHTTGKNGEVKSLSVEADGTGVVVSIAIRWNGGVLGTLYTTVIRWRFNSTDHLSSGVESDTAPGKVGQEKMTQLDDYLRKKLLPQVYELIAKM